MANLIKQNEGTSYESIDLEGKWETLSIESKDTQNDVEIEVRDDSNNCTHHIYLNQEQLKIVISFLQKQVVELPIEFTEDDLKGDSFQYNLPDNED